MKMIKRKIYMLIVAVCSTFITVNTTVSFSAKELIFSNEFTQKDHDFAQTSNINYNELNGIDSHFILSDVDTLTYSKGKDNAYIKEIILLTRKMRLIEKNCF